MPEPARRPPAVSEGPPIDPLAIERAYRRHRAQRRARIERKRHKRLAALRFWLVLALLLGATIFLALSIWHQVQQLFGL